MGIKEGLFQRIRAIQTVGGFSADRDGFLLKWSGAMEQQASASFSPRIARLVYGNDDHLYATTIAASSAFNVLRIDPADLSQVASQSVSSEVGDLPLAWGYDDKLYTAQDGDADFLAETVIRLDPSTLGVESAVTLGNTQSGDPPDIVAMTHYADKLYVVAVDPNAGDPTDPTESIGQIYRVDGATLVAEDSVIDDSHPGFSWNDANPHRIVHDGEGFVYVQADNGSEVRILKIRTSDMAIVDTFQSTGGRNGFLAWATTGLLYSSDGDAIQEFSVDPLSADREIDSLGNSVGGRWASGKLYVGRETASGPSDEGVVEKIDVASASVDAVFEGHAARLEDATIALSIPAQIPETS